MRLMTWVLVVFGASLALAPTAAAELKVAVVDAEGAIGQSEEAKQFIEALQQQLAPQQEEIKALQTQIQEAQQRITDEGDVMSETERRSVAKDLENMRIDLDFRAKKYQKEAEDGQAEFFQGMAPKFRIIINDLIELERYDFVFGRGTVLFANMRHDITAKVTEKLNEQHAETD